MEQTAIDQNLQVIKTSPSDDEPADEHWKFDRADWMSFRTLCVSQLSDELAQLDDPVAQFTDTLIEIATFDVHLFPQSIAHWQK